MPGTVLMLLAAWMSAAPSTTARAPGPAGPPEGRPPLAAEDLSGTVRLGRQLFDETATHPLTKPYAGNALACSSCHPEAGTSSTGATLVGAATAYPAWSPREKAVITLEDRVLNCFMRSLNGQRPENGSRAAVAMTAYVTSLSAGLPLQMNAKMPLGPRSFTKLAFDPASVRVDKGRALYSARCAPCHGDDGDGEPPVWGPRSFNAGAGLAEVPKLAGWIKVTMPPDDPGLSDAEAVDVAAFIDAQPRPDFVLQRHLRPGAVYNSNVADIVIRAPTWPSREKASETAPR